MKAKQSGFTLIELMMVVAIIGVLASIALPSYQAYVYRAKAVEVVEVLDKLHTVLAGFQSEKGQLNTSYAIHDTGNHVPKSGSALYFYKGQSLKLYPGDGEVSGMNSAELTLDRLGIKIGVMSGIVSAEAGGQYAVYVSPIQASDTQARQVVLAVRHVMQNQAYKTVATSHGSVLLYFQL